MEVERYKVTTEDGKVIDMTLELTDHGGFDYGNGHSLILTEVGINESIFDARYDKRFDNEESFRKNALKFVREHVRSTCKVERIGK